MVNFPPQEEWLELAEDNSYLVSTFGRLYDLENRRLVKMVRIKRGRSWEWVWNIRERRSTQPSRGRAIGAARSVLVAFVGNGCMPLHADGDRSNVRLSNLSWGHPSRKSVAETASAG